MSIWICLISKARPFHNKPCFPYPFIPPDRKVFIFGICNLLSCRRILVFYVCETQSLNCFVSQDKSYLTKLASTADLNNWKTSLKTCYAHTDPSHWIHDVSLLPDIFCSTLVIPLEKVIFMDGYNDALRDFCSLLPHYLENNINCSSQFHQQLNTTPSSSQDFVTC